MSLWNDYLARKLIFESHPTIDENRCLNRMQTRHPCRSCMEVCPEGVFSMPFPGDLKADWDLCSGCGLCVSACPSRAVSPARIQAERLFSFASRLQHDTIISCKSGISSDIPTEYPGALNWEFLCFLALYDSVTIITGDCAGCEKTSCRKLLEKNLSQAKVFLGEELYSQRVILTQDPSAAPARRYTRREALSLLMAKTGRTASTLLPLPQEYIPDGTLWRQILLHKVKQLSKSTSEAGQSLSGSGGSGFSWMLPHFEKNCTACGICTRVCPAGALLRAPGPEGSGRFYMALLPHKCTGCGHCSRVCPEQALAAPSPLILNEPDRPLLTAIAAKPCIRCKEPVPVDSGSDLCARCRGELSI